MARIEEARRVCSEREAEECGDEGTEQGQNLDILEIPQIVNSLIHDELYGEAVEIVVESVRGLGEAKFSADSFAGKFREEVGGLTQVLFLKELLKKKLRARVLARLATHDNASEIRHYRELCSLVPRNQKS